MYAKFSPDNMKDKQEEEAQDKQEKQRLSILSYYQSTLRNVGVFTTLSLASLAAAHSSPIYKNPWGGYARYASAFMFLCIAIFISWRLVQLRERYIQQGDPLGSWKYMSPALAITHIAIFAALLFSFINKMN